MRLEQVPRFQPITIVLETPDDANTFISLLNRIDRDINSLDREQKKLLTIILDWFSTSAQF